jgi:hypothetical protein
MISLLLSLTLSCPTTILVGWAPNEIPSRRELTLIENARRGCNRYYGPEPHCLKSFTRINSHAYSAICISLEDSHATER